MGAIPIRPILRSDNMKNKEYLWDNVVMPIYRQMYKEAEPSADFDELLESLIKEGKKLDWSVIKNYYLSMDRQTEILDEHAKKHKLTKREKYKVSKEIFLGCSPNSVKED